jgi:hypothetical protein
MAWLASVAINMVFWILTIAISDGEIARKYKVFAGSWALAFVVSQFFLGVVGLTTILQMLG